MLVNALFLFLMFRCGVDILSPEEKGTFVVAAYVVVAGALTALKVVFYGTTREDIALCAVTLWLLIVNLLWIPADATPQLYFSVTILLPIIFLLLLSRCDPSVFVELRRKFFLLGTPMMGGFLIAFLFREGGATADLLTSLNEQPFHVVAQTVAKFSILLIDQWTGFPLAALIFLVALNVRSALLGFVLGYCIREYRSLWSLRALFVVGAISVVSIAFLLLYPDVADALFQRMVYRDRDSGELDTFNITSGRDEIWLYYIEMLKSSSLRELLFGRGAIWLYGDFSLEAHNDLLNLMVSYGLAGTATVMFAWYIILSRLDTKYRLSCVALFLVLFFTNGVVFHQSNLLFLLFMAGEVRREERYEGSVDEGTGRPGFPVMWVTSMRTAPPQV